MRIRVPVFASLVAIAALAYIWFGSDLMRQIQVMVSVVVLALTFLVVFAWFVLFSGASKQARLAALLAAGSLGLGSASLFRLRGFTGDLVPIVEYRFASARVLPEAQAPVATAAPSVIPVVTDPAPAPTTMAGLQDRPAVSSTPGVSGAGVANPATPSPVVAPSASGHQDWPQFLGPDRSGAVPDAKLATDWAARPPKLLWRQPVGAGWAGFAVSSGIAVTQEQRGNEEYVMAYDLMTGRPMWSHADQAVHNSPLGGIGPRTVPTIDGGQVFTQGATGLLRAFDLRTGRLLWSRNILKDNHGVEPEWGVAISPLVRGSRVVVSAGGTSGRALVAYDRSTGEPSWGAGSGGLAYSSPVLMTLAGREQIVMLNTGSVAAHDPETGAELWTQEVPGGQPNVAPPLRLSENRVLFSVGYGIGSKVFEISPGGGTGLSSRLVWSTPRLKSKFANMVLHEGSIYGLDDGVFVCLDPLTGERRWKSGRFGHGQLILAGRHLLMQTEDGEILLIEPSPERLIEVARFRALDGKTWNPPAFAAPILLVRNDLEAAAYELPSTSH